MQCRLVREWNSTAEERADVWPCDRFLPDADDVLFRAVDVAAPPHVVFLWLCQLHVAPYSYDWIDNWGRQSPRELTPGLDQLAVGQRMVAIFDLVDFAPDDHITIQARTPVFGEVVMTYRVRAAGDGASRLAAKLLVRSRRDLLGLLWRVVLPTGDLIMMRKQLQTLAALAERTSLSGGAPARQTTL